MATDVLDAVEPLEDIDEEELLRESVFRGTNMPLTSSGFMELFPLRVPHAGREIWGKEGGLATAVMRKDQSRDEIDAAGTIEMRVVEFVRSIACPSSGVTTTPPFRLHGAQKSSSRPKKEKWTDGFEE